VGAKRVSPTFNWLRSITTRCSWGEARIDITISDLYAYDYPLNEKLPIVLPDNPLVTKIGLYPTYDDAMLGFSMGLKLAAPYEVSTSESPARIVVEVLK